METDISNSIDIFKQDCAKIIANTKRDIANLQIGDDMVGAVANFMVKNNVNHMVKLGHIAKVTQYDSDTIQINVYDPGNNNSVLASLNDSSLGSPRKHNNYILLTIPPLTIDFITEQVRNLKIGPIQNNINYVRDCRHKWHKRYYKNRKSIGEDVYTQNQKKIDSITKENINTIQKLYDEVCRSVQKKFHIKLK